MKAASLSYSLLVRKGLAMPLAPAMPTASPPEIPGSGPDPAPSKREANAGAAPALLTPFRRKQKKDGLPSLGTRSPGTAQRDHMGRVRLSLRLDLHRHLRLKLLAAHTRKSVQELLVAALDRYLEEQAAIGTGKECSCLANGNDDHLELISDRPSGGRAVEAGDGPASR